MKHKVLAGLVGSALLVGCQMPQEKGPKSLDFSAMDTSVAPGDDFFLYANGTWLKENPVPSTDSRWGSFNELQEENNKKIKALLKEASEGTFEKGSAMQHIGDFYLSFMDSTGRDAASYAPVAGLLEEVEALTSLDDLTAIVSRHHTIGFGPLFGSSVYQDLRNNTEYAVYVGQAGFGLPDKDYYFKTDEKSVETRAEYVKYVDGMFALFGREKEGVGERILEIETKFSEKAKNRVEQRNIQASYNKMSVADLQQACPAVQWQTYFAAIGLPEIDTVIVGNPAYMEALPTVLNEIGIEGLKELLVWELMNSSAGKLSGELVKANFDFYSTYMRGTKEMKPFWKRAISAMNFTMGESLGRAFVEKHYPEESKQKVNEMVTNLTAALKVRLEGLEWMSDTTKQNAFEKMESFTRKLGYPDEWKDLSSINITKESYFNNWMEVAKFNHKENIDKYGKAIDKKEWGMPAHIVNAYYNPLQNEIVFPAGIMQPPFFDPEVEDVVNYARMGAVIGHEMIHGFDDQGAQFNSEGSFQKWWTDSDYEMFQERTTKLEEQFNDYSVLPDLHVNGKLTLGENIADFGGLTIAYYAFKKSMEGKQAEEINGFTPEQRFFISFGQIWKCNYTDESLRQLVQTDPHSPTMWRVKGTLANMPEFFEAFDIEEGEPMRNSGEDLVTIW